MLGRRYSECKATETGSSARLGVRVGTANRGAMVEDEAGEEEQEKPQAQR